MSRNKILVSSFYDATNAKLTSGGLKAKAFQKAEKALRWQIFEKPHYTSRLS